MTEKIILGIETSCDDTSISIVKGDPNNLQQVTKVIAINSFSQEIILKKWGGVVPEIAARNHLEKIHPLLEVTLENANIKLADIDLFAVTTHPGLLGPLLTGINAVKTLSLVHKKPIAAINHLYAHLEAIWLSETVSYPYLGLLVSGGHSMYLLVHSPTDFEIIGNTIDDAAGEAFDKGGKILGLGYPAGKIIDDTALSGDKFKYSFPISYLKADEANLSFSGVKTSLRNFVEDEKNKASKIEDVCASYQHAIVSALTRKLKTAMSIARVKTQLKNLPIVVGGGVACNSHLRSEITNNFSDSHFVLPKYCTDNGAMIANLALRTFDQSLSFPECLTLDARGQFVSKSDKLDNARGKK